RPSSAAVPPSAWVEDVLVEPSMDSRPLMVARVVPGVAAGMDASTAEAICTASFMFRPDDAQPVRASIAARVNEDTFFMKTSGDENHSTRGVPVNADWLRRERISSAAKRDKTGLRTACKPYKRFARRQNAQFHPT